ncbi:MAG: hypothetical protein ABSB15_02650 [Bryobacteraceae bacterium]
MDFLRHGRGRKSYYYRLFSATGLFLFLSLSAFAQTCTLTATQNIVHAEGLAEPMGNIAVTCSGGTIGATVSATIAINLNTNVTNRLDLNGNPLGITAAVNATPVTASATLTSATSVSVSAIQYTVSGAATVVTVGGIVADVAAVTPLAGIYPVTATITVETNGFLVATGSQTVASGSPSLLSSVINRGVPCNGSAVPASLDFNTVLATDPSSTIRLTEAYMSSFSAKAPGADAGFRIIVNISGYGPNAQLYVPDTIVGSTGAQPTSDGSFATVPGPGSYTAPGQLLLILVTGADATGAGGTMIAGQPSTSMTALTMSNGSTYVVYEVADSNPDVIESAQLPIFVSVPLSSCPSMYIPRFSEMPAPVSTVSTAGPTAPIPRFVATQAASDCLQEGDCSVAYYPALSVNQTAINLTGLSLGGDQTASVQATNNGQGILPFTTSITYQSGAGWLSVTPSSGATSTLPVQLQVVANPSQLAQGTYTATLTISAGNYGTASIPVTFTVGPVGVTIQNVGNAASYQYGTVAPGSYAVIFGLNLAGASVTFNSLPATIIYNSASQINLIVPAQLGQMQGAIVSASVNGMLSNPFQVTLVANAPGIFTPGIVNLSNATINGAGQPASRGSNISVYLTGLSIPLTGQVTVNIGSQSNLIPLYAGAQPTYPALDQVNVTVPASLPATGTVPLQVCIPGTTGQPVCSNTVSLYVQ